MSLKHILNDDPSPPLISTPSAPAPVSTPALGPALKRPSSPSVTPTTSPAYDSQHYTYSRSSARLEPPLPPPGRAPASQPPLWQSGRHPYYDEREQRNMPPSAAGDWYDQDASMSGQLSPSSSSGTPGAPNVTRFKEGYVENSSRKKRKTMEDDEDYQPPGQKRVSIWRTA